MLFSSFSFLFWFLPAVLALYFLPALFRGGTGRYLSAYRNGVLLVASLFFYAWGEPIFVLLMLGTALFNYALALAIPRARHRALPLALAVCGDLALLILFKYPPLFGLPAPHLPLGISFYTFQAISYVADVYRGAVAPCRSPLRVLLYLALFPQLVAGPIVRYTDVNDAISRREHTVAGTLDGACRFVRGLAKKVLLADAAGALFAPCAAALPDTAVLAWLSLLGFTFQIYFDFSGYSDMAIGLGRIFGFSFGENFDDPYISRSVTEFWRRWHISLSSFFREYVYFPLGGSRRGTWRTVRNLLIVWALTGLWHGASFNFLLWGLYYFLLLTAEKLVLRRPLARLSATPLARPLTFLATMLGWLIFAFDGSTPALTLGALPRFLGAMVGLGPGGATLGADLYDLARVLPLFLLCALFSTPLPRLAFRWLFRQKGGDALRFCAYLGLFVLSVSALADAAFVPFLYFRF